VFMTLGGGGNLNLWK